jgi:hypothetical protein
MKENKNAQRWNQIKHWRQLEDDYARAQRWENIRQIGCLVIFLLVVGAVAAVVKFAWKTF